MINKNVLSLKQSATLLINEKVKDLRKEGRTISHFGFGQSPFPIFPSIVASLQQHADNNHYLPVAGLESLREHIVSFLAKEQGIHTTKEAVFIGPGSKELLYQTILIFEAEYLIPKGSWVSYIPQIQSKGGTYHILDTDLEHDFKLTAHALEAFLIDQPKEKEFVLILNSPNNPTGTVYSLEEYKALAEVCKKYSIMVMSDEIYSQINFNQPYSPSISAHYPEGTIVFGGLSKVFSAGGYRLGYMMLPEKLKDLQNVYKSLFSETFSCVSSPVQYAAINAYEYQKDLKQYVADSSAILKGVSAFMYDEFTKVGVQCTRSEGAFYMVIGFNTFKKQLSEMNVRTSSNLAHYILEHFGVAMLPGVDFGFQEEELFFRLAFVDFDGANVMDAYQKGSKIDALFIKEHCPSIYNGVTQVQAFVKSME
ncbi:aminotransferase class I/II-fold pyridoxal phosphate-dependent enzyme [Flavobacteriaceae bacterium S356]|uniref:Aminotransferase n=1 Tax=Asprobacillus argus TaxID=3076534 RepID=A0ABU3LC57_9FLAO|nr:aminotransferase class I/II-fold pyridoxal phosphate-dependent enzyme [Flavobacteriaceae bacterium S356]